MHLKPVQPLQHLFRVQKKHSPDWPEFFLNFLWARNQESGNGYDGFNLNMALFSVEDMSMVGRD